MRLPARLLRRKADSHKGDFGRVFLLAGSLRYSGAALLAAEAALRSGAGLVTLGLPRSVALACIRRKPAEVMLAPLKETAHGTLGLAAYTEIVDLCQDADVLAIGPGLSRHVQTQELARLVVRAARCRKVIDADALTALAGKLCLLEKQEAEAVLTPHPGEMARLLGSTPAKVQKDRKKIAKDFTNRYNVILVLKGFQTLVAQRGRPLYVNRTGNPGMAKGGSGDVLCGMIAAFMAQGLCGYDAARYAVYLHGLAGDIAARQKTQIGMTAGDIIASIPAAIRNSS